MPLLSSLLLILAYPQVNFHWLIWIALVPLLTEIRRVQTPREAFGISFFTGFFFFLISIFWLRHVSWFGLVALSTMMACYFGAFGWLWKWWQIKGLPLAVMVIAGPALWVGLEWMRTEMPSLGFGWNLLGYALSDNLIMIQSASLWGVYGVSFLIMFINIVIARIFSAPKTWRIWPCLVIAVLLFIGNGYYGVNRLKHKQVGPILDIGVVQGNIEQHLKWEPRAKPDIIDKHIKLSQLAAYDGPDLIVWPEAAYPGYLNLELEASVLPEFMRALKVPVLIGSPHMRADGRYQNSAYLINEKAEILERYDKTFLVPFGEFIPYKLIFGFLNPIARALGVGDFLPGDHLTVFDLALRNIEKTYRFSVLICFEDVFPRLSRRMAQAGAQCLIVMTNDAWFGNGGETHQHLQASVFRAVENGLPVIRSANVGVSAFIDPHGRVADRIRDKSGQDTFIMGTLTRPIMFMDRATPYREWGHWFPILCLLLVLSASIVGILRRQ